MEGKGRHSKMGDERDIWVKGGREKAEFKGGIREGRMGERGKVVVLSGGCMLSEVGVWNHPGPCNS